eukprot:9468464-Pyramimonas_sp.AAC.1
MLLAAEFATGTMDEETDLIKSGFQAGRAYAPEAARLRDERQRDPSKPLPEVTMGPARVQIFLVAARRVSEAGEK